MATRHGSAQVTLPSDTEMQIVRSFEAPLPLVWDMMTTPEHLLRWWGPSWHPMIDCQIDLRVGGTWRYTSRGADGQELSWHGTYQKIEPLHRIVTTEIFELMPDAECLTSTTYAESDGVTTLTTLVTHQSKQNRDGHIQSGMEAGMQETHNRLDDLLASSDFQQ